MLHHAPAFALLDESTSAVSRGVEEALYALAASPRFNITLVSVAHQRYLFKLHKANLHLSREDGAVFRPITPADFDEDSLLDS
jgi:ABC-type uncharacterized transport system fused permease/ATPase subunit